MSIDMGLWPIRVIVEAGTVMLGYKTAMNSHTLHTSYFISELSLSLLRLLLHRAIDRILKIIKKIGYRLVLYINRFIGRFIEHLGIN